MAGVGPGTLGVWLVHRILCKTSTCKQDSYNINDGCYIIIHAYTKTEKKIPGTKFQTISDVTESITMFPSENYRVNTMVKQLPPEMDKELTDQYHSTMVCFFL